MKGHAVNPFWSNIFRSDGDKDTLAYFLGTVPVFSKLNRRDLRFLESIVHVRNYQADEIVFQEGEMGSGMYAIRSGQVLIYHHDDQGRERDVATLETGDFFGEVALTATRPRLASAKTTEPAILVGLFRADLLEAVRKYPSTSSKILLGLTRVLSDRLHHSNLLHQEQLRQAAAVREQSNK